MRAFIVTGLGYGDEGKGATVDYLVRAHGADLVVRFNGGAQAGHNVVLPDPNPNNQGARVAPHHEFRQIGSGSFVRGVRTHIAWTCVFDPEKLFLEAERFAEASGVNVLRAGLVTVDERAPIVTPWHRAANKIRETARGAGRHGSCGLGIWEAELDRRHGRALTLRDVRAMSRGELENRLRAIRQVKAADVAVPLAALIVESGSKHPLVGEFDLSDQRDTLSAFATVLQVAAELLPPGSGLPASACAVFEGAQGALLDEDLGWRPHVTGSRTGSAWALHVLGEGRDSANDEVTHLGVTRAYATRHGAGPFVTEDDAVGFPEPHNGVGQWQGDFRQGHLDLVALRYAALTHQQAAQRGGRAVGRPGVEGRQLDGVVLTHVDALQHAGGPWLACAEYEHAGQVLPGRGLIQPPRAFGGMRYSQASAVECLAREMAEYRPRYVHVEPGELQGLVELACGAPVVVTSTGPTHLDRQPVGVAV